MAAAAGHLEEGRRRVAGGEPPQVLEIGHQWGLALALMSLGVVRSHLGRVDEAREHVLHALRLFDGLGNVEEFWAVSRRWRSSS
jgi:hypothetical protein